MVYRPKYKDPNTGEVKESAVFWMKFVYQGACIRESTKMTGITRAREVENKRKQALRDGAAGLKKREAPKLFSVAAADFRESKKLKWSAKTIEGTARSLNHLTAIFGKKLLVDIEARDVGRYQRERLAEGASNRTINIEVGFLRALMRRNGLWARIQPEVEMLPERDDRGRALNADEEAALLHECAASRSRILLPFVTLLLETGSRYGTVQRLQWRNVDLPGRRLTFGKDKTRAGSGRTIPLTPRAYETLAFWAQSFPDRQPDHFVFPYERYGGSGSDETFGFTGPLVHATDPARPTGSIKSAWESARARTRFHCPECKAGLLAQASKPSSGYVCGNCSLRLSEIPQGLASVRIHDLRHTAVSRMIAARIPLPMIQKIVGWSAGTLAKMSARYGHFSVEEMRSALESISRAPEAFRWGGQSIGQSRREQQRQRSVSC
jgi:integrase